MLRSAEELWYLLREAYGLPYGAAQIAMFDQVLPYVDGSGDPELAYTARIIATTAYAFGGEPAKAFVTFARCLSEFDTKPAPYHARMQHTLLWDFKTMISALLKFPEVPLARTYAVIDDMERRYREGGHSLQAVYKQRYQVAQHVGDLEQADAWYERWVTAPRDDLSDCIGCDPSDKVAYLSFRARDEEAVALAEPVLAGELTCTEQPQTILNELMEPFLRTGRLDAAADAHRRAYRLQRHKLADLSNIGAHIALCARTGNEPRGLEILQRHVDWLEKAPSPAAEMRFAAAGALLLRRLVAIGHGDVTVRVGDNSVQARVLSEELAVRASRISERFDARNGTDAQSRRIDDRLTAEPYEAVLSLSPTARRGTRSKPEPGPEVQVPAEVAEEVLTLAEAAEVFRAAADDLHQSGDLIGELRLLRRRLVALHYADEVAQAEDTIRVAADRCAALPGDLAEQPPAIWSRAMLGFEAARVLMSRGRYAEALPHLRDGAGPLRTIGASDDADQVEGMYAEALLRSGSPVEAEALLRPLLDGMGPDAPTRAGAADVLADTLDALGRAGEAAELRIREGLNDR